MTFELLAKNIENIQTALQQQAAHAIRRIRKCQNSAVSNRRIGATSLASTGGQIILSNTGNSSNCYLQV